MNKVLIENIIYFWVINYCYKSKKLECHEEILKKKKKEEIVNVNDDKENFNEKIKFQNNEYDDCGENFHLRPKDLVLCSLFGLTCDPTSKITLSTCCLIMNIYHIKY